MTFDTQSSSRPRLSNDTLGDDAIKSLNEAYAGMDLIPFKQYAENMVMSGGGKLPRKLEICKAIQETRSKETAYKKACDFILAGMGLGV